MAETAGTTYLMRMRELCGQCVYHFAYAAADSLDSEYVDLADTFERYATRCAEGKCGK